ELAASKPPRNFPAPAMPPMDRNTGALGTWRVNPQKPLSQFNSYYILLYIKYDILYLVLQDFKGLSYAFQRPHPLARQTGPPETRTGHPGCPLATTHPRENHGGKSIGHAPDPFENRKRGAAGIHGELRHGAVRSGIP